MTLLPNSTLKFNISYSSLTHLSLTSNSMESRVINLLAFKSHAGERNIARVWVGYRKTEYIQHQNAFKIKYLKHCRSVPQFAILVWNLSSVSLLTLSSLLASFCHWHSQILLVFLPELLGQHDCHVSSTAWVLIQQNYSPDLGACLPGFDFHLYQSSVIQCDLGQVT